MNTNILAILAISTLLAGGCTTSKKATDPEKLPDAKPTPVTSQPARVCELVVEPCLRDGKPCAEISQCNVTLARVNPEGIPLDLNLDKGFTWSWKYAADGRLLESPQYTYTLKENGIAERKSREGDRTETVTFDGDARLAQIGEFGKLTYTADGRIASVVQGGPDQVHTIHYAWGEKGTFAVSHDYPDTEEVCEPGPSEVRLDARDRVQEEKFSECQINYSPFNLKYEYDAQNRPTAIDVTCYPAEPTAVTWRLKLKYDCK
ncbi:hypothetical protein KKD52_06385 [Myxococcota bacterium]|nr:hypothetical protein [Myxococcota bacterium]MBU1412009.1 hypothetical protein [Myxococcota bacterium]MBU1509971.1 hypothetical protein [Myxococcota bacterium]